MGCVVADCGMWHCAHVAPFGPEKTVFCHSAKVRSMGALFGVTMSWHAPQRPDDSFMSRSWRMLYVDACVVFLGSLIGPRRTVSPAVRTAASCVPSTASIVWQKKHVTPRSFGASDA